jgi:hypothetical protein
MMLKRTNGFDGAYGPEGLGAGLDSGREIADAGAAAPAPPLGESGPLRGRERFVGGETRSYSRRAAGFAPDAPHILGKARPLWEA